MTLALNPRLLLSGNDGYGCISLTFVAALFVFYAAGACPTTTISIVEPTHRLLPALNEWAVPSTRLRFPTTSLNCDEATDYLIAEDSILQSSNAWHR